MMVQNLGWLCRIYCNQFSARTTFRRFSGIVEQRRGLELHTLTLPVTAEQPARISGEEFPIALACNGKSGCLAVRMTRGAV